MSVSRIGRFGIEPFHAGRSADVAGPNDMKDGSFTKKVFRCTPDGWEYEADPKHVEKLLPARLRGSQASTDTGHNDGRQRAGRGGAAEQN